MAESKAREKALNTTIAGPKRLAFHTHAEKCERPSTEIFYTPPKQDL